MYKMLARVGLLSTTLVFSALTAAPAHADGPAKAPAPRELGTLGGHLSRPTAISDLGQVVGVSTVDSADTVWHGFIWHLGKMRDIGNVHPNDNNNRGHFAVAVYDEAGVARAGIWRDGKVTDLGVGDNSYALALNDKDEVVGYRNNANLSQSPFVWRKGVVTYLDNLGFRVVATDINNRGEIVGGSGDTQAAAAIVWRDGEAVGISSGRAYSINDHGVIVGRSHYAGFLWRNGTLVDLPSAAYEINNRGDVVGSGYSGAYRWRNGTVEPLGIARATGINSRGQIIGYLGDASKPRGVILG